MSVRVRFAPSPTGYLHIGNVRTALFNWLFARHEKGTFILRVEDTDKERSDPKYVTAMLDSLKWLGLDYQEGPEIDGPHAPYFQAQRISLYRKKLEVLTEKGRAYPCFCTPEELEERKAKMVAQKLPPRYDGKCREIGNREALDQVERGQRYVWRFKTEPGVTSFDDIIHGPNQVDHKEMDDFVIMKSDGMPMFNFACAVDDGEMGITHVIRGDDHLSNTPKQIMIHEVLGNAIPRYAHLPQILGPDKKRLSKRHGATLVTEYREMGFKPEALVNYLALLGWSTSDSQQIFSKDELIEKFGLERVGKSPAIFDQQKLNWMNGVYIRGMGGDELLDKVVPLMQKAGLVGNPVSEEHKNLIQELLKLEKDRIKTFEEFPAYVDFFFKEAIEMDGEAGLKLADPAVKAYLGELATRIGKTDPYSKEAAEKLVRAYAEELKVKASVLIHPLRAALSGRTVGPGLFDIMGLLGREKCVIRINKAVSL